MFSAKEQKEKAREFEKRIELAKKNSAQGKFAIKIQRAWRRYRIRNEAIRYARKISGSRFRDLSKALSYQKIREKFFLTSDKFQELFAGIGNCLSLNSARLKSN